MPDRDPLALPARLFNQFIQRTNYAITNEQSRFTLSGAKFIVAGGSAKMITTDGHRLAFVEEKVHLDAAVDVLIPKKALLELVRISREAAGDVAFGEDPNHIYFEVDGRLLISRKLGGNFPNYDMVIPKDNDKTVRFDVEELKQAIRRVALMSDERTQSVKLLIKKGEINISSQSSEEGESDETIAADYDGEETMIGFNWRYVQDFLGSAAGDDAGVEGGGGGDAAESEKDRSKKMYCLSFRDANGQAMFHPDGKSFLGIIMPLRV